MQPLRTHEAGPREGWTRRRLIPPAGCTNISFAACRNWRASPIRSPQPAPPYCRSPQTGMADRGQVDADLVRATGLERDAQQRRARQAARSRSGCAPRAACRWRSSAPCGRGGRGRSARRSCRVRASGRPSTRARYSRRIARVADLLLERAVHRVGLGHHEQAAGVAVEPVDDARPPRVVAAGGAAGERLRERAGRVPGARVHHHAGGLVHHDQVRRPRRPPRAATAFAGSPGSATRRSAVVDHDALAGRSRWRFGPRPRRRRSPRPRRSAAGRPRASRPPAGAERDVEALARVASAAGSSARSASLTAHLRARRTSPRMPEHDGDVGQVERRPERRGR